MVSVIHGSTTKRVFLLLIFIAILFTLLTGCGTKQPETTTPILSEQPTQAVTEEVSQTAEVPSQTPETRSALPSDLLSDELNVFSDVAFPEGYVIYAAGYENNIDFFFYELYLTAEGSPEEIITYISNLLGDNAEESTQQNIDYYRTDGGVGVDGAVSGLEVNCKIIPTEEEYDYDYVEGCNLRLRATIEDTSSYDKIIEDNYNLYSLSNVADYFDLTPFAEGAEIYVRKMRDNAQLDAMYIVEDAEGIMESMKAELLYEGFDETWNFMSLPSYGEVDNNISFDLENNRISIYQSLADSAKNYKEYKITTTQLTDYGFTSYIESDAMCEFKNEANDLRIAVNIPQWGSRPDEWENNCVLFLRDINGYILAIWYYPDEGKYSVQADKDGTSAKYEYYTETGKFDGEYPDSAAVIAQFEDVFRESGQEDVYMQGIEMFNNYVYDTFGMSIDELYAIAAK